MYIFEKHWCEKAPSESEDTKDEKEQDNAIRIRNRKNNSRKHKKHTKQGAFRTEILSEFGTEDCEQSHKAVEIPVQWRLWAKQKKRTFIFIKLRLQQQVSTRKWGVCKAGNKDPETQGTGQPYFGNRRKQRRKGGPLLISSRHVFIQTQSHQNRQQEDNGRGTDG